MDSRFTGPLNRLRALGDAWARILATRGEQPGVVRAFLASRDPLQLPSVLALALSRDPDVRGAAAEAIHGYLSVLQPRDLVALDDALRRGYHWSTAQDRPSWDGVRPTDIDRLRGGGAHTASVLGLASFHPSGYVRELAVRALAGLTGGAELPYLLIRLNDWVGVVQEAAGAAVRARLTRDYAPRLVRSLWLLARLERGARTEHKALVEEARRLLSSLEWRPALHDALDSTDRWLRRMCCELLMGTPGPDMPGVIRRAVWDEDTVIRVRAAERAEAVLSVDEMLGLLPVLRRDPFMPVRREALRLWVRYRPQDADAELRRVLFDRHATIREVARYHLRRRGFEGFGELYRSVLGSRGDGPKVRAALYGLSEVGDRDDLDLVEQFLAHRSPGIRKAAVVALGRLAPDAPASLFLGAMEDPSAGVSKAARHALAIRRGGVGAEELWDVFRRTPEEHVRNNALSLLAGLGKWESIGWIIRACGVEDEPIAVMARQHLRRWLDRFNRNQTQPTRDQLQRTAQALDTASEAIGRDSERMLRFLMKGY
jgi:hypothetical protein